MRIFTLISMIVLSISAFAGRMGEVAIVSNTGERFYVILNETYQNRHPQSTVQFNGSSYDRLNCTVVSANRRFHINKLITPRADKRITYRIVNRHGFYQLRFVSEEPLHMHPQGTCGNSMNTGYSSAGCCTPPSYQQNNCEGDFHPNNGQYSNYGYTYNLMDNAGLERLKSAVAAEAFSSDKLRVAKNAARNKRMTVNQIIQIANLFTFSDSQLAFTKAAYSTCVNKSDYYEVMRVFTFSSDKQELQQYINRH